MGKCRFARHHIEMRRRVLLKRSFIVFRFTTQLPFLDFAQK
jgi:hypothetical protein